MGHRHRLNLGPLRQLQRVLYVNAKVPDGALNLCVAEQNLNRKQIARGFVDDGCFRPAEGVGAIFLRLEPNASHPARTRLAYCRVLM